MPGPVYVFACKSCGREIEVDRHSKESVKRDRWVCMAAPCGFDGYGDPPVCGGEYRRVWHPAAHTWHVDFK